MSRKLLCTVLVVSLLLSLVSAAPTVDPNAKCARIRVRREVRDLSDAEWKAYVDAVKGLHNTPATRSKYSARGLSKYDELVAIHNEFSGLSHADPRFLVWHRAYLLEFEDALQAIDPTVTIPYWAWAKPEDANAIEKSTVLSAKYFGSSQPGQCIPDGPFANWSTKVQQNALGQSACVRRGLSTSTTNTERLATLSEIGSMMRQVSTFSEFSFLVEFNTHPGLHVLIGTDKRTNRFHDMATMISPNDVVFFSHHAFMDKVWHDFQLLKNVPYEGQRYLQSRSISKAAQTADPLTPLVQRNGKPWTVGDVYDSDEICVKYLNPGDVVLPIGSSTTSATTTSSTTTTTASTTSVSITATTTTNAAATTSATSTTESGTATGTETASGSTTASDSATSTSAASSESALGTTSSLTTSTESATATTATTTAASNGTMTTESSPATETSMSSDAVEPTLSTSLSTSTPTTALPRPTREPIIDIRPLVPIDGGDKPREPEPPVILPPVIRPQPQPEPEPIRPQPPVETPVVVVPPVIRPIEPTVTRPSVIVVPTATAGPTRPPVINSMTTSATATATATSGAKPTDPPTPVIPGIGGGDHSATIPSATFPAPAPTRTLIAVPDAWRQLMKLPAEAVKDAENYWNQVVKDVQAKKAALEQAGGVNGGQHSVGAAGDAAGGTSAGSSDYPAPDTSEVIRELRRQQQSDAVKAGQSSAEDKFSSAPTPAANSLVLAVPLAVMSLFALAL